MAEESSLALVKQKVTALHKLGAKDLEDRATAHALVSAAVEANTAMKEAKELDTQVKDEFKRICTDYMAEGKTVTCYSIDSEHKMVLSPSGGGYSLDEEALLAELYTRFGEVPGDKTGKAWKYFCEISDPVDVPRKVNEEKLAKAIAKADLISSGQMDGEIGVTSAMVQSCTTEKAPTYSARISAMTKAEKKLAKDGELKETFVVS